MLARTCEYSRRRGRLMTMGVRRRAWHMAMVKRPPDRGPRQASRRPGQGSEMNRMIRARITGAAMSKSELPWHGPTRRSTRHIEQTIHGANLTRGPSLPVSLPRTPRPDPCPAEPNGMRKESSAQRPRATARCWASARCYILVVTRRWRDYVCECYTGTTPWRGGESDGSRGGAAS